jgi:hypothetical protein
LKTSKPIKKTIIVKEAEYPNKAQEKPPVPRNAYLKVSIIPVIGFNIMISLYLSGTADNGKITGVAH